MYSVIKINCADAEHYDLEFYIGESFWFVSEFDCAKKFGEDKPFTDKDFEDYIKIYKEDIKRTLEKEGYEVLSFSLHDVSITARRWILMI